MAIYKIVILQDTTAKVSMAQSSTLRTSQKGPLKAGTYNLGDLPTKPEKQIGAAGEHYCRNITTGLKILGTTITAEDGSTVLTDVFIYAPHARITDLNGGMITYP